MFQKYPAWAELGEVGIIVDHVHQGIPRWTDVQALRDSMAVDLHGEKPCSVPTGESTGRGPEKRRKAREAFNPGEVANPLAPRPARQPARHEATDLIRGQPATIHRNKDGLSSPAQLPKPTPMPRDIHARRVRIDDRSWLPVQRPTVGPIGQLASKRPGRCKRAEVDHVSTLGESLQSINQVWNEPIRVSGAGRDNVVLIAQGRPGEREAITLCCGCRRQCKRAPSRLILDRRHDGLTQLREMLPGADDPLWRHKLRRRVPVPSSLDQRDCILAPFQPGRLRLDIHCSKTDWLRYAHSRESRTESAIERAGRQPSNCRARSYRL